jgi:hypothetical protein
MDERAAQVLRGGIFVREAAAKAEEEDDPERVDVVGRLVQLWIHPALR